MITRLLLKNFQGHERFDVKLGRVTTFIGPSDAGKSSLIRALRWLLHNQPGGVGMVRDGTQHTRVAAAIDGVTVRRERVKHQNEYHLGKTKFVAFQRSVPEEIQRHHRVREASIQSQIDPPFWMTLSGGQLAAELNEIVDLQRLLRAQSRAKSDLARTQREHTEAAETVERLQWVDGVLRNVKKKQKKWEANLDRLQGELQFYDDAIDGRWPALPASLTPPKNKEGERYLELVRWREKADSMQQRKEALGGVIEVVRDAQRRQHTARELSTLVEKIHSIREDMVRLARLRKKYEQFSGLIRIIKQQREAAQRHAAAAADLRTTMAQQIAAGGTCPLCQSRVEIS